jgi:phenylacetate-CoA ligase
MNQFLNPATGLPFIKSFLFDPGRMHRLNPKQMKNYKDKVFRNIVRYACTVPVYKKKFKALGIHPNDISGIDDVNKLPFTSKKDLVDNFPENVLPSGYKKQNATVLSTSGSTGKPVSFYVDFSVLSKSIIPYLRLAKVFDLNWRKDSYVNIGNLSQGKADQVFEEGLMSKVRYFLRNNTVITLNAFGDMDELVRNLNRIEPDILVSYPVTFRQLAYLKKKGYADKVNPKIIIVSGYTLDGYTRNYVKDAFNCAITDMYSSAESCSYIAFECEEGIMHINQDFYHLEAIDENNKIVSDGKKGHVVMTRMFGKGTPFVRYTGMDDWVTLHRDYECNCGLCTDVLKNGVEGRRNTSVILPDGRVFPSASFAIVSLVLKDLKTYKVKQFQIIQKKINEIEILLVIDDELRDTEPSVDLIFKKVKEAYEKMVGPEVTIKIKEVDEIKAPPGKPLPLVVSNVRLEEGIKKIEEKISKNKN